MQPNVFQEDIIYETKHFIVRRSQHPFVDRDEGGHLLILPKVPIEDRTKLTAEQGKELMKLTMVVGQAFVTAMKRRGIDIGKINYQDMGNWNHTLHIHILGRAKTAIKQKYGEAVFLPQRSTGFYDEFKPLNEKDMEVIKIEIEALMETEKYKNF